MPYILAFMFFKKSTTLTCNSVETVLGVERQERDVGAEDMIFIEFNDG